MQCIVPVVPARATVPLDGLIGYWTGNGTAADASPLGNDGSFAGSYAPGRAGSGEAFNLATGKVYIPNISAYNFQSYAGWSVGFWFDTNGIPIDSSGDTFLGQDNGSGYQPKWFIDYGYTVYGPNQNFALHFNDSNQERIFLLSQAVTIPTGWNQLTVTIGSTVTFYLNGQVIGSDPTPGYVLRPTADLVFGYAESCCAFDGLLQDVTIYDRTLSAPEVAELASTAVPEPGTLAMFLLAMATLLGLRRKRGGDRRMPAARSDTDK